jgi:HSP20 family protein
MLECAANESGMHAPATGTRAAQKELKNKKGKDMRLLRVQKPEVSTWSPFDRLLNLRDEIDRLFDTPSTGWRTATEFFNGWTPPVDLYEDKESLIVKAELPGFKKDEIDVSVHNDTLAISGERRREENSASGESHRSERFFGRFHRTVALPKPVEVNKVKATYTDGVLTVTLPKTEEAKPKQIEVQTS